MASSRGAKRKKHQINDENIVIYAKDSEGNVFNINLDGIRNSNPEIFSPNDAYAVQQDDFQVTNSENMTAFEVLPENGSGPLEGQPDLQQNEDQESSQEAKKGLQFLKTTF